MASTFQQLLIEQVKKGCGVTEERAIELLKIYGNDVDSVKRHQCMMQMYGNQVSPPKPPGSRNPTPSRSTPKNATGGIEAPRGPSFPFPFFTQSTQDDTPSMDGIMMDLGVASAQTTSATPSIVLLEERRATNAGQRGWDFLLPALESPDVDFPEVHQPFCSFSVTTLAQAIQHDYQVHHIERYLSFFKPLDMICFINDDVQGFSPIFYAVATYDVNLVRLLVRSGASVNAVHEASQTPLLAFAIICGESKEVGSAAMVCTLLSLGASPLCIPESISTPYMAPRNAAAMPFGAFQGHESSRDASTAWCSPDVMARLLSCCNLTHRYFLDKARKLISPSERHRQVAQLRGAEDLLGVPYFMVGQQAATDRLIQQLLRHLVMPTTRPLVLCFAGPSGHGKTELARQLGRLLSLNLEVVDCTAVQSVTDLFGPRHPYQGWQQGSPVNNFLTANTGQSSIVFLDEFEKTSTEIHQSLLLPLDDGEYQDRRNKNKVNCSKTIWIMATNAFDNEILDFCKHDTETCSDDRAARSRAVKRLSQSLRKSFLQKFGGPLTGRMSDFIPFLPFSTGEQAVITHKYVLDLKRDLRLPVVLSRPREERFIGNIRLNIRNDAALCTTLANEHYHNQLGARSLIEGAKKVKHLIVDEYLDDDEEIEESEEIADFTVYAEGEEIRVKKGT